MRKMTGAIRAVDQGTSGVPRHIAVYAIFTPDAQNSTPSLPGPT